MGSFFFGTWSLKTQTPLLKSEQGKILLVSIVKRCVSSRHARTMDVEICGLCPASIDDTTSGAGG